MAIIDALDSDKITFRLAPKRVGKKVLIYNSTSSTNDVAAEYAKNAKNDGLVIFAEQQTIGRGRGSNRWFSGYGDSLLCSVLLAKSALKAELLSLTVAVAVAEAIGKISRYHTKIKWPNDIIINNKKIAGILLESKTHTNRRSFAIGIGINCHQSRDSFSSELQKTATSIDIEAHTKCDRITLAKRLLSSLDHWLDVAGKDGEAVINQWKNLSTQLNHRVKLLYNNREFVGTCIGIDPRKGLIVKLDTGRTQIFDAVQTNTVR